MISPELLQRMACPGCGGEWQARAGGLACVSCNAEARAQDGVWRFPGAAEALPEDEDDLFHERRPSPSGMEWRRAKERFLRTVRGRIDDRRHPAILHVGCGTDSFWGEFGEPYVALDAHFEALRRAGASQGARALIECPVERMPFRAGAFDAVLCIDLVHHFYTRGIGAPLREMARVLQPGGLLFLDEINRWGLWRLPYAWAPLPLLNGLRTMRKRMRPEYLRPAAYEAPLSFGQLRRGLRDAGFERVERLRVYEYPTAPPWMAGMYRRLAERSSWIARQWGYHISLCGVKSG